MRASAAERDRWAVAALLRYFSPRTGRWRTPTGDAWQPALAIEAVLTSYRRTREIGLLNVVEKSFAAYRGRRSRFFDDDGWYANAWLRAWDATGDPKYLAEAREVFAALTDGWDATCGGGLWWSRDRTYKNAITNELFLLAAARLYRRTGEQSYLDLARREWDWFAASGLINPAGLVNDGLDGNCVNNGQSTWTYNQGVILSGLVELAAATGDPGLLGPARRVADAAIAALAHPDGTLREPSEPSPANQDAHVFKGVFVQGLARLAAAEAQADAADAAGYGDVLTRYADTVWGRGRRGRRGVGLAWTGPGGRVTAATHTAACLLLAEVAALRTEPTPDPPPWSAGVGYPPAYRGGAARGDGAYLTFEVSAARTGPHILTFAYTAPADARRSIEVDGAGAVDGLLFTAGTSTVSVTLPVRFGRRTVSVVYNSDRASTGDVEPTRLTLR